MAKKKKRRGGSKLLAVLVTLLLAVAAVIVWRLMEYKVGDDYYGSLREMSRAVGRML